MPAVLCAGKLPRMIGTLAVGASLAPVVVGLHRRMDGWRWRLWCWLAFLAAENLALRVLAWQGIPTWWVTWACYPVAVGLGLWALLGFPVMARYRSTLWPVVVGFVVAWIAASLLGDRQAGFSVFVAPFHALILAGLGGWLFVRSTGPERVLTRSPQTAALATVLTYGPFLAVWPVSVFLATVEPSLVLPLWEARAGLLIVGSLLYAIALW